MLVCFHDPRLRFLNDPICFFLPEIDVQDEAGDVEFGGEVGGLFLVLGFLFEFLDVG